MRLIMTYIAKVVMQKHLELKDTDLVAGQRFSNVLIRKYCDIIFCRAHIMNDIKLNFAVYT